MHNHVVHLPGEHPVTRGEDLWPQGDGVGDVALNYFKANIFNHLNRIPKDAIFVELARLGRLRKRFPWVVLRVQTSLDYADRGRCNGHTSSKIRWSSTTCHSQSPGNCNSSSNKSARGVFPAGFSEGQLAVGIVGLFLAWIS